MKRAGMWKLLLSVVAILSVAVLVSEGSRGAAPRRGPGAESGSDLWKPPLAKRDGEKKILSVLDEMTRDRARRWRSVSNPGCSATIACCRGRASCGKCREIRPKGRWSFRL